MTVSNHVFKPSTFGAPETNFADTQHAPRDLSIGEIISQANNLSAEQIQKIADYQKKNNIRFGEAAVALGLANNDDVLWALAQQFHYPYAGQSTSSLPAELVTAKKPFSEQAESFRTMRSRLIMRLYSDNEPRKALAIISPDQGDGKTYFSANLAAAFSQLSGKTLLVDADMRNPRLHEIFGLQDKQLGLSSILSGRATGNVICPIKELPSLYVLPAGPRPPNPLELLERPAFGLMIKELLNKFDHIIVDTPAASQGSDSAVISAKCGSAVIIARQHRSRMYALQELLSIVSMGPIKIVGSVMNEFR